MWLKRISIVNYKNLEQAELSFSRKMNCIIGKNGMGKTNHAIRKRQIDIIKVY